MLGAGRNPAHTRQETQWTGWVTGTPEGLRNCMGKKTPQNLQQRKRCLLGHHL
ncbi:hypothetical protein I79_005316 [Cricetulus griseus]|uniref:Uncharacterized protein n=1 Tax=Cricetulus griseus TaxID=10029 RepID=G3H4V3_CRIGR|nr:hypothetical protein I79_005316 [Cricetulus griseus]